MYRLGLILALAACSSAAPQTGFRPANAPIYSNAVMENQRLVGTWQQVAEFAGRGAAVCKPGQARISQTTQGLMLQAELCLAGKKQTVSGQMASLGPGRFGLPGQAPWWVLWVDTDYRSVVIGTPSGAFGFILNREPSLPRDRLRAAREVLEWNGYDLKYLR